MVTSECRFTSRSRERTSSSAGRQCVLAEWMAIWRGSSGGSPGKAYSYQRPDCEILSSLMTDATDIGPQPRARSTGLRSAPRSLR